MPMPYTYRHASEEFRAMLAGLRAETLIASDNVLYTGIEAVLRSFRACLTPEEAIAFADQLPAVLRAIFVQGWDVSAAPRPWPGRARVRQEMTDLRRDHNFCPPDLLEAILHAIPATTRRRDLDRVLARIGPEAVAFWSVGDAA